jgi:hypothetical protein
MFLIIGLALFKALHDEFPNQEELIDEIHDILWKGRMNKMGRFLAFFVRRSRDPFHRYLQILGPNNEWFSPCPPWEKVSVEIQNGIGCHQMKCPSPEGKVPQSQGQQLVSGAVGPHRRNTAGMD